MDFHAIETLVNALNEDSPQDQVIEALSAVLGLQAAVRALKARADLRILDWLEAHQNAKLECGGKRWVSTVEKTTKCLDFPATLRAIGEASEWSVEALAACLSADPFKPSTTRTLIGEDAAYRLFETKCKHTLEGRPVKSLKGVDPRYLDGGKGTQRDNAEVAA